jgi:hypothetical protein
MALMKISRLELELGLELGLELKELNFGLGLRLGPGLGRYANINDNAYN